MCAYVRGWSRWKKGQTEPRGQNKSQTKFQARVQKTHPIFQTKTAQKQTLSFGAAHTYIAYVLKSTIESIVSFFDVCTQYLAIVSPFILLIS